jgi:hypothetical protein
MLECEVGIRLKWHEAQKVKTLIDEYKPKLSRDGRPLYVADDFVEQIGLIYDEAKARALRGEQ